MRVVPVSPGHSIEIVFSHMALKRLPVSYECTKDSMKTNMKENENGIIFFFSWKTKQKVTLTENKTQGIKDDTARCNNAERLDRDCGDRIADRQRI